MQTFVLVDNKKDLADAWSSSFKDEPNFEIHGGVDIFDYPGDAVVSPANSFGFMDGGIDLLYSLNMGWHVQQRLREKIMDEHDGELLVGQSTWVPTDYRKFPILICCPTMRVPCRLKGMPNVYLAAKALFTFARRHPEITRIVCPGLGTGTGGVVPAECAEKMKMAYNDFYLGKYELPSTLFHANIMHAETIIQHPSSII